MKSVFQAIQIAQSDPSPTPSEVEVDRLNGVKLQLHDSEFHPGNKCWMHSDCIHPCWRQHYDNDNSYVSRVTSAGSSEELAESHVNKTTRLATEESEQPLGLGGSYPMLCAAKDETSVEFMGRMFCCNFLRKS
jgi:hypothetical protein